MEELTDLQHIRERPSMYVGSRTQRGIQHLVFEAIDNAVDQFLARRATRLDVVIDGHTVQISDDGDGYPLDLHDGAGLNLGEKYLTRLHGTNTADGHVPHVHANGYGCGLFVLNALTRRLTITSIKNGQKFSQEYSRGVAQSPVEVVASTEPTGTLVEFELDPETFDDQVVDQAELRGKLRRLSFLFPGLVVSFQGEVFGPTAGLVDLLRHEFSFAGEPAFSISVQLGGTMIAAAAVGETDERTEIVSFANAVPTLENSSHVKGLRRALTRAKWRPAAAAISIILADPQYAGPTRQELSVPGLDKQISDLLAVAMKQFRAG